MASLIRHAWMDLLSAGIFFLVFLFREHFEPATLSALLLWPVVFELLLVFALVLAGMGDRVRTAALRHLWFASVASAYLVLAWWGSSSQGLTWLWIAALWQLIAKISPVARRPWFGSDHREWMFREGLPYSAAVWVLAFFAYLVPMAILPGDCVVDADGERHCTGSPWLFGLVWSGYFVAEALVRAWRISEWSSAPRP